MKVYYMVSYDINDMEDFQHYPTQAIPLIEKHGGQVLVADTEGEAIEGKPKMMNVVVSFPSKEQAMACYNDPDYQEVKKINLHQM